MRASLLRERRLFFFFSVAQLRVPHGSAEIASLYREKVVFWEVQLRVPLGSAEIFDFA